MRIVSSWLLGMALLGLVACGTDPDGGGRGDICDEGTSGFDQAACFECLDTLDTCMLEGRHCEAEYVDARGCVLGKCLDEFNVFDRCTSEAFDRCWDEHAGDRKALEACTDAACKAESASFEGCGMGRCHSQANTYAGCVHRACPGSSACFDVF